VYIFLLIIDEIAGGQKGFGDNVWKVEVHKDDSHVTFTYHSFDGEQGLYFYLITACCIYSLIIQSL